ncbi:hypothetical protein PILCRDRAFT_615634 [Piloderma croceum F 1598]|uniref:Uncharacterized protein n=1 Tax=Piloderma croceum (strain F 1598) TaxID=765440 RepID=A0A0C3FD47_PILCF|nr:hypothetical protein PILCRDRAFT_615634 [Piloderma croceum F 1598]
MRLQYARLKVEHGWQRQNLNEVENLYFHHSAVGRTSTNSGNTTNNANRAAASKVGHLAAPPVVTFQLGGTGVEGAETGEATESGTGIHNKEMPGVHVFSAGQETASGTTDTEQMEKTDVGCDATNDESQLDPRILMESAEWGAVERRNSGDLAQGVGMAQIQVQYAPSLTSTSPWLVGTPSAQSQTTQSPTSTVPPNSLNATNQVALHPYFASYPQTQLPYPVHTPPHSQSQPPQQTPLRLSNVPRPEVSVPPTSLPDTAAPISQNPPRSRSGSASPWQNGNHTNANPTVNTDANASTSPAATTSSNNGFGSSALTYDSFWSGFRGSTTPTAMVSLPASTSTPASTTSTPSVTGGRTRTRSTNPANSTSTRTTTTTAPAAPVAVIPPPTSTSNPFDMDLSMSMNLSNMNMNMAMAMGGMNMGMLGMGMGLGVVDDNADGGSGGSYGFGQ